MSEHRPPDNAKADEQLPDDQISDSTQPGRPSDNTNANYRPPDDPETAPSEGCYRQETRNIRRVAFILNPASAKGHARKTARVARKVLEQRGLEIVDFPSDTAAQARDSARRAAADSTVDAIVVSGGDGILSLVLQEQVGSDKPLGIIPAGSGNDHARHYGIPLNPRKSAGIIADGFVSQTDLGLATFTDLRGKERQRWWSTITCVGFDQMVADKTQEMRWPHGSLRYILSLLIILAKFHPRPVRLSLDGVVWGENHLTLCAVANGKCYGGGVVVAPQASSYDGVFSISTLSSMPRRKVLRPLLAAKRGKFAGAPGVTFHEARQVSLEMEGLAPIADGERLGYGTVNLECVPRAGWFILPRPEGI